MAASLQEFGVRSFMRSSNQLTSAQIGDSWKSDFIYDGKNRLRKRIDYTWNGSSWQTSSQIRYIYDGMTVVQERNSANTPTVTYTRGTDLSGTVQGAGGIGGLLGRSSGYSSGNWSTHNHYHADGNGNITFIINSSQTIAASYKYNPFGGTISSSGGTASANTLRFSSKDIHSNTGLYYYGYRFYDPNLQRWLNRDPKMESGGPNLYVYVSNSPVYSGDAWGLEKLTLQQTFFKAVINRPFGIDDRIGPCVMTCLLWKETSFDTNARNRNSTAVGIAQILKGTADTIQDQIAPKFGGLSPYVGPGQRLADHRTDPDTSIFAAYLYLDDRSHSKGSLQKGLDAYGPNSGKVLECATCLCKCPQSFNWDNSTVNFTGKSKGMDCLYLIHK